MNDVCVMRFDHEAGKGDHKHVGHEEVGYDFQSLDRFEADFRREIELRLKR